MNAQLNPAICEPEAAAVRAVRTLDPLRDPRWDALVARHPSASIFHTSGWLEALRRTYGYEPLVVTTTEPGCELTNGLVLCRVKSWLTGARLVSLPFSDHCEPLVDDDSDLKGLLVFLKEQVEGGGFKYLELRPVSGHMVNDLPALSQGRSDEYCLHRLDLGPSLDELQSGFHKSCVRRKIHKAEREGLAYEEGRSEELLAKFYEMLLLTRRRHQLPPQSMAWFRNLASCLGDRLKIRVVSKDGHPVASIITCHVGQTAVYKYGCSDARYHNLGGVFLLLWRAIQDAKAAGARCFDLGRSERQNEGLMTFKAHWGAMRVPLPYYRYPVHTAREVERDWRRRLVHMTCARLPDSLLKTLGRLLYRHVG